MPGLVLNALIAIFIESSPQIYKDDFMTTLQRKRQAPAYDPAVSKEYPDVGSAKIDARAHISVHVLCSQCHLNFKSKKKTVMLGCKFF